DQAARELGLPAGSMSRRLARGRDLLRRRLAGRGLALSTGTLAAALAPPATAQAVPPVLHAAALRTVTQFTSGAAIASAGSRISYLAQGITGTSVGTPVQAVGRVLLGLALAGLGFVLLATPRAVSEPTFRQPAAKNPAARPTDHKAAKPPAAPDLRPAKDMLLRRFGGDARSEAAVAASLDWLARHQAADGHWSLDGFPRDGKCNCGNPGGHHNDIAGTAFGLLPLLGAGYTHLPGTREQPNPYEKTVRRGLDYLLRKQAKTGDLGGGMYAHGLAGLALCEAYGLTRDARLKRPAQLAVNYTVFAQHGGGGWRYAPK